jgi:hypothetical protein
MANPRIARTLMFAVDWRTGLASRLHYAGARPSTSQAWQTASGSYAGGRIAIGSDQAQNRRFPMAIDRPQIDGADNRAARGIGRRPRETGAASIVEPCARPGGLARAPDLYDLVRFTCGLALSLATFASCCVCRLKPAPGRLPGCPLGGGEDSMENGSANGTEAASSDYEPD